MKKILMVSTHGYFEAEPSLGKLDTGGQMVFVLELSKTLEKLGYTVDILTRKFDNLSAIEKVSKNIRIIRFPCHGNNFIPKEYLVKYLPELIDNFLAYVEKNKINYDFINSHYWDGGFVGEELKKRLGIVHLFTPHSLGIWKQENMKKTLQKKGDFEKESFEKKYNFKQRNKEEKRIMRSCHKVVATTPKQKEIIVKKYKVEKEKAIVITPGFDSQKYIKTNNKNNLPDKFVFTAGRLARNKGYDLLIKAMPDVIKEVPKTKLVLAVGSKNPTKAEKEQKKELLNLAQKLGIKDKIIFFNHVNNLEDFYSQSDVFVLSSTYEPFGITAIEAMACQTPTVVTDKGGLVYFLKDKQDALIANPFNAQSLTKKIVLLLKDEKLKNRIIKNGYKKVHAKFTWDQIGKQTLNVVQKFKKEKILCSDLDGTFIGNDKAMYELIKIINKNNFYLIFSTGRDLLRVESFIKEKNIQKPHAAICMVGTEIYVLKHGVLKLEKEWKKILSKNWNRKKIEKSLKGIKELVLQEKKWQSRYKLSYFLHKNQKDVIKEIKKRFKEKNIQANIIFSANQFLDILPINSGKGKALEYLIKKMNIKKNKVIVCGDSGNDIDLFQSNFKGIIVANAHKELKEYKRKNVYHAQAKYAQGIIEGIKKFK